MNSCPTECYQSNEFAFFVQLEDDVAAKLLVASIAFLRQTEKIPEKYAMVVPQCSLESEMTPYVSPEEAVRIIRESRSRTFRIRYDCGDRSQGIGLTADPTARGFGCFSIGTNILSMKPASWKPLIEAAASEVHLTMAGVYDGEYMSWQSCSDAEYYRKRFGPVDNLRITSPLPPPFDHVTRLDISTNPGRFACVGTGPAFVSADMWLGPAFWTYAPCRKEEILAQSWLKIRQEEHFLYLNAYPEPFTRPDGEQGEIQRRLWQLLFHSDCRWPPNKGEGE